MVSSWVVPTVVSVVVVAVSAYISCTVDPSPWHPQELAWWNALSKPFFTPPTRVFGLAWAALYGLMALCGAVLFHAKPSAERTVALSTWLFCVIMIAGWSLIFFGAKLLGASLVAIVGMLAASIVLVVSAWSVAPLAAALAAPFLAWISFATVLTAAIWSANIDMPPTP
jgi:translocator protein